MTVKRKLRNTIDEIDFTAIIKTNQGTGSGLDSDLLDGLHGSAYEQIANKGVANGYASLNTSSLVIQNPASKGQANGLAELDAGGKVPSSQLPALALTDIWTVASEAEQLALTAQEGDVAIRTDQNKSYAHNGGTAGTMADWSLLLTPTDAVLSVFGRTGAVVAATNDYTWGQIDKTISSLADITTRSHTLLADIGTNTHPQIDTHLGAVSPHSGHELIASKDQANGYPGLSAGSKIAGTQITYGTAVDTACVGNDSRLSDARTPTGTASGDLADTYPNPTVALLAITDGKVAAANKDGLVGTPCLRTLGTGAQQACAGNDSRLSDARTPLTHASTHNRGGSDIALASRLYSGSDASKPGTGNTEGDVWWATDTDKLYVWDGTAWKEMAGSGATTFLGLTDTPSAYTGQGGKLVRVNSGATGLEFLNELDKLKLTTQLGVGSAALGNNYLTEIEGTSVTWGALLRINDTRVSPGGQRSLSFASQGTEVLYVDNLGNIYANRQVNWNFGDTAKYGRLTYPINDGYLGLGAYGTDANIDLEIRPKGEGVLYCNGYLKAGNKSSLPTAGSAYRGWMARVEGGAGVADEFSVCKKDTSGGYFWQRLDLALQNVSIFGGKATWTDMPAAVTELFSESTWRARADLTKFSQVRLFVGVFTIGATGAELRAQYSTDATNWYSMDGATGPSISLGGGGLMESAWVNLVSAAKADVYFRIVGINGDGVADPVIGRIELQFR